MLLRLPVCMWTWPMRSSLRTHNPMLVYEAGSACSRAILPGGGIWMGATSASDTAAQDACEGAEGSERDTSLVCLLQGPFDPRLINDAHSVGAGPGGPCL